MNDSRFSVTKHKAALVRLKSMLPLGLPVLVAVVQVVSINLFAAQSVRADDDVQLGEVVVTASRVATSIQDTPFSISAIGGNDLRREGLVDLADLSSQVPGLLVSQGTGDTTIRPALRGIAPTDVGAGAISPVAVYLDDVYLPYAFGAASQMYDLNRVEVLRGPQGTLFGKNVTGGAMLFYSQLPTSANEGYLTLDAGSGDARHGAIEGAANLAISDTVSARASFRVSGHDGFARNLQSGKLIGDRNEKAVRVQLAWTPASDTTLNLLLFGVKQRGDAPVYQTEYPGNPCAGDFNGTGPVVYLCSIDGVPAPTGSVRKSTFAERDDTFENSDRYGATLKATKTFGNGVALTSITGWQKGKFSSLANDDGLAADWFHSRIENETSQFSQEIRLTTRQDSSVRAVLGGFYQHDRIDVWGGFADGTNTEAFPAAFLDFGPFAAFYPFLSDNKGQQKTDSYALFGSLTYDLTQRLSLIGGLRYSSEKKDVVTEVIQAGEDPANPFVDNDLKLDTYRARFGYSNPFEYAASRDVRSKTWSDATWDVTAKYTLAKSVLLYAKVGTGFLSGGYTLPNVAPGSFNVLAPEKLTSYEAGLKSQFMDNRLRMNVSVYYSDYKDMQVTTTQTTSGTPLLTRENAGAATIKGAELELAALPVKNLEISFTAGYADAKFDDFATTSNLTGLPINYRGNRLPFAPRTTGSVAVAYTIPVGALRLDLRSSWTYRDRVFFDANNDPLTSSSSTVMGDFRASLHKDASAWRVTAYVTNLTNQKVRSYGYSQPDVTPAGEHFISYVASTYSPLRNWGLQVEYAW